MAARAQVRSVRRPARLRMDRSSAWQTGYPPIPTGYRHLLTGYRRILTVSLAALVMVGVLAYLTVANLPV